jgi:hypothetical protein
MLPFFVVGLSITFCSNALVVNFLTGLSFNNPKTNNLYVLCLNIISNILVGSKLEESEEESNQWPPQKRKT